MQPQIVEMTTTLGLRWDDPTLAAAVPAALDAYVDSLGRIAQGRGHAPMVSVLKSDHAIMVATDAFTCTLPPQYWTPETQAAVIAKLHEKYFVASAFDITPAQTIVGVSIRIKQSIVDALEK